MSIKYKEGDLINDALKGEIDVIAHCCNCFNRMGPVFASKVAKTFPSAKEADNETAKGSREKLGTYSTAEEKGVKVFNLYGQYNYGPKKYGLVYVSYLFLYKAMDSMAKALILDNFNGKIGLPRLGVGNAGGEWSIVESIIESTLTSRGFDVTVYDYKPE